MRALRIQVIGADGKERHSSYHSSLPRSGNLHCHMTLNGEPCTLVVAWAGLEAEPVRDNEETLAICLNEALLKAGYRLVPSSAEESPNG